jgi:hypothetical protein
MSRKHETMRPIGVDLGQQRDYTAISVTERVLMPTGKYSNEPYWDGFHSSG